MTRKNQSYSKEFKAEAIKTVLDIMLSDVKEILGEDTLKQILNCPEFLPKNKKASTNYRSHRVRYGM